MHYYCGFLYKNNTKNNTLHHFKKIVNLSTFNRDKNKPGRLCTRPPLYLSCHGEICNNAQNVQIGLIDFKPNYTFCIDNVSLSTLKKPNVFQKACLTKQNYLKRVSIRLSYNNFMPFSLLFINHQRKVQILEAM